MMTHNFFKRDSLFSWGCWCLGRNGIWGVSKPDHDNEIKHLICEIAESESAYNESPLTTYMLLLVVRDVIQENLPIEDLVFVQGLQPRSFQIQSRDFVHIHYHDIWLFKSRSAKYKSEKLSVKLKPFTMIHQWYRREATLNVGIEPR
jgi:hypothetical protein